MRKNFGLLILACLLFVGNKAIAQHKLCATDDVLHEYLQDPEIAAEYWQSQADIDAAVEELKDQPHRMVITIPVVFHVIHDGDAIGTNENISDEQLISQLDALNRDFRRLNSDSVNTPAVFKGIAADTEIEFCLARFDPQGFPTSGIERLDLGKASWDRGAINDTLKPTTIWDRDRYLNIWTCNFGGDLMNDGVLGFAQFPGLPANTDGIAVRSTHCGTIGTVSAPYNMGRTVVHEVGHWLDLRHVWGDPPQGQSGCTVDDGLNDTPNQDDSYFGCPSYPQGSCGSEDMFMNYMDYASDACSNLFTQDQKIRMIAALNSTRSGILAQQSLCTFNLDAEMATIISPSSNMCSGQFTPKVEVRNNGGNAITSLKILFQIDNGSFTTVEWAGNIPSLGSELISLPPQNIGMGAHTITVIVAEPNGVTTGDDFVTNDNGSKSFTISATGNGNALPFAEGFEGSFPPAGWDVVNADNGIAWSLSTSASGFGNSSQCAAFLNFDIQNTTAGQLDELVTPDYDFTSVNFPSLEFDVAHARKNAIELDSLLVYFSWDCGFTWTRLWQSGGSDLATAPDIGFNFIPLGDQWSTKSIPIQGLEDYGKVRFRFVNKSGGGNNTYVDNINISSVPASINDVVGELAFDIFPNPTEDYLTIDVRNVQDEYEIKLFNALGEVVFAKKGVVGQHTINLEKLAIGVYFIEVSTDKMSESKKILLTK